MIDGAVKDQIDEAIRFLQPGVAAEFVVNEHSIRVVALADRGQFLVACETCRALLTASMRKPYLAIHKHVKADDAFDASLVNRGPT